MDFDDLTTLIANDHRSDYQIASEHVWHARNPSVVSVLNSSHAFVLHSLFDIEIDAVDVCNRLGADTQTSHLSANVFGKRGLGIALVNHYGATLKRRDLFNLIHRHRRRAREIRSSSQGNVGLWILWC